MSPISKKLFGQHVRDALIHYHDPVRLQRHPLGQVLIAHVPEAARVQALRATLLQAIERLRPEASIPYGDPAWWPYRALWMRYIEAREVYDICAELALGRSSFYEHHRAGMEALVDILWSQVAEQAALAPEELAQDGNAEALIQRELAQLAQAARAEPLLLEPFLRDVLATVAPLAEQYARQVQLEVPSELPTLHADPALLRQALVNVLAEAVGRAKDVELMLQAQDEAGRVHLRLGPLRMTEGGTEVLAQAPGFRVGQTILTAAGGQLGFQVEADGGVWLHLLLPGERQPLVLAVDNDADTLSLYRRYLEAEGYCVQASRSSEEARRALAEARPDLVLLDLLMPEEDGWKLLQELKRSPVTADIPVLVCSVLSQPQLALALGAADVLNKPIGRAALLRAIQAALGARRNSPGDN